MVGINRILTENDFLDALDSVVWYNGLGEEILKWKNLDNYNVKAPYDNYYPDNWLSPKIDFWSKWPNDCRDQLEVIWMICVILFGDYGTSPRSGWIEKKDEFFAFIDAITETDREQI